MIKNTNKKESRKIAKNLNIHVHWDTKALSFTQDGDTKIALLDIKQASQSIVHRMPKNPDQAHNLRWLRNTEQNKRILADYLMRRVIKYILGQSTGLYYMPCCNSFSFLKPKEDQGHKQVTNNCLLLLLGEEIKSQAIAFKKQEREKNKMVSWIEFLRLFRSKVLPFFKEKTPLEWVGGFIENLPKKNGCFQLPLIKQKPFLKCPGPCPLFKQGHPLLFKVDLVTSHSDSHSMLSPTSSPAEPRRTHSRYTKSSKKKNKKLKTHFLSSGMKNIPKEDESSINSDDIPPLFLSIRN